MCVCVCVCCKWSCFSAYNWPQRSFYVQARTAELSAEAEKLPRLRKELVRYQAAASEVRVLEARIREEQLKHPEERLLLERCVGP
jgi:hypothetical protein